MTRLFNAPQAFADEMVEGFAAAASRWVTAVPGGVVRRGRRDDGRVAVVIGGGSGHYPAFGGLVGEGLADGAAMGNVFASPSAHHVHSVAQAAHRGGGVLLSYGNYAGDVLNFDQAQEQLRAEGIPCRTVVVTDDVSSAPVGERSRRRGIAGDLIVFKLASAAAAEGRSLDAVADVARRANDRTRSFGVAFSGCTLPGASEPLFTVPEGRMAVGLGIHGEPGIGETDLPTADGLADLFVSTLLAELPDGAGVAGARVALLLNGLGSVKYEELFVVYRRVSELLRDQGVTVVEPEVGELCTSFDMAGASLTLCWLDDELEKLWRAPADAPAYRKFAAPDDDDDTVAGAESVAQIPPASRASQRLAARVAAGVARVADALAAATEELGRIDAVAGDGDHGIGMRRGSAAAAAAAAAAADRGAGVGTTLALAGDAWAEQAGGTSGALWGLMLRTAGTALGDDAVPTGREVADATRLADAAVRRVGKAELGDKTMVDVTVPFATALGEQARTIPLARAWNAAALVATSAAAATADLVPRRGRARSHGTRSVGTPDAGAVSFALVVGVIAEVLKEG